MHQKNPLEEIRERLRKYPQLRVTDEGKSLTVHPHSKNGFEVWFSEDEAGYTVGYDGWHEHFEKDEIDSALGCFGFGLSGNCRLKVILRGGKTHKWMVEAFENGEWISYSTTGLLLVPFWRKKEMRYLSNDGVSLNNA